MQYTRMPNERNKARANGAIEEAIEAVRSTIRGVLQDTSLRDIAKDFRSVAGGGKMLRSRLALRLGAATVTPMQTQIRIGAAVEMIHAASLLHDDVIDQSERRRGAPTVWVEKGVVGAVLLGDLLVSRAIGLIAETDGGRLIPSLVQLTGEMCDAVARQELLLRGEEPDWETCMEIARGKTGALFAFAASACPTDGDLELHDALLQAGYDAGTAYQLADDVLDVYGDPEAAGKSLGTDEAGAKITAVSSTGTGDGTQPAKAAHDLCAQSRERLAKWPGIQAAWDGFLVRDLKPAMNTCMAGLALQAL